MIWVFDYFGVLYAPQDLDTEYNWPVLDLLREVESIRPVIFTSGHVNDEARSLFADELFEHIITIRTVGRSKSDPQAYKEVAQLLKVQAADLCFIDDQLKNILAAEQVGVTTHHFQATQPLITQLRYWSNKYHL